MEPARIAVVQLCVDDRLDHPRIRAQVARKLESIHIKADRILLVGEIGGNLGESFRNTVDLFQSHGDQIVFCALLHHDDCSAAAAGRRRPMEQSLAELSGFLSQRRVACSMYTGNVKTSSNEVSW